MNCTITYMVNQSTEIFEMNINVAAVENFNDLIAALKQNGFHILQYKFYR